MAVSARGGTPLHTCFGGGGDPLCARTPIRLGREHVATGRSTMDSVVRYKFKSSTMEYSVAFSGPHIGLFELKKAIVTEQKMSAGSEATLELTHAQSGTVYADDALVARNTAVLVRRVPAHTRTTIVSLSGDTSRAIAGVPIAESPSAVEAPPQQAAAAAAPAAATAVPPPAAAPAAAELRPISKGAGYASTLLCPLTGRRYVEAVVTTCCGATPPYAWCVHAVCMVRAWCMRGACVVRAWHVHGMHAAATGAQGQ